MAAGSNLTGICIQNRGAKNFPLLFNHLHRAGFSFLRNVLAIIIGTPKKRQEIIKNENVEKCA